MPSSLPLYLEAILEDFLEGHESRSIHLGYWPVGSKISGGLVAGQAQLDDLVIKAGDLADGLSVLDVACGLGGLIEKLNARYRRLELTGLNIDPRQLNICNRLRPKANNMFRWVEADASRLPFPDASFDRLFCVEAMFHFASRGEFLSEAFRVLKPEGRLVVTDILLIMPATAFLEVHAQLLAGYGPWPEPWIAPRQLVEHCANAGFTDIHLINITAETFPTYRFIMPSQGVLSSDPLARSLAALHGLHANGNLVYCLGSAHRHSWH
jgi:ubiquinone/menaquinone biosynthesis C-methylase UbiE